MLTNWASQRMRRLWFFRLNLWFFRFEVYWLSPLSFFRIFRFHIKNLSKFYHLLLAFSNLRNVENIIRRPLGIGVLGSKVFTTEGCIGPWYGNPGKPGRNPGEPGRNPGEPGRTRAKPGRTRANSYGIILTFLIIKVEIPGKTSGGIIGFVRLHWKNNIKS